MHEDHEDPPQNKHVSDHQKELRSLAANPTLKRKSVMGQISMFIYIWKSLDLSLFLAFLYFLFD